MKKYYAIARAEWLDAIQNRAEISVYILIEIIPILIIIFLWQSNGRFITHGLSTSQLVTYYLGVLVCSRLTGFYFDQSTQEQIRDGTFSRFLLKPLRMPFAFVPQNLGGKVFNTLFLLLPIIIFIVSVFHKQIIMAPISSWPLVIASLIVAYLLNFFISKIVTTVAFFWEQSSALVHIKWVLESVAGGYLLPLSMFPTRIKDILNLLPFKYLFYFPTSIYIGELSYSEALDGLIIGILWAGVLGLISNAFWNSGLKRYSSVGG